MQTEQGLTTGSISGMMDYMLFALFIGSGLYLIYSAIVMRRAARLKDNKILLPADCAAKDCKDPRAYIAFIFPRAILLGAGLLLCGALLAGVSLSGSEQVWVSVLLMLLPLALMIWYVKQLRTAEKTFWR